MTAGIRNRTVRALSAFLANDLEEALYQIAPAIDATAKKRYSASKPGVRVRNFLKDEQDLIYGFSTQNRALIGQLAVVLYEEGEFQSVVYKFVRNAQSHDCELDKSKITLGGDFGVGRFLIQGVSLTPRPGTILISRATVLALIFAVICAAENANLDLSTISIPFFSDRSMNLAPFVGNKAAFVRKYQEVFA